MKTVAGQIPVFISEWGTTDSSGHGAIYLDNANQFMDVANGDNNGKVLLSWCNWSWSNDSGSGSCKVANNYSENNFTESGKYVIGLLKKGNPESIETVDNESFAIYPTGKGSFQITLNSAETANITVYSFNGQTVYNTLIKNGKGDIQTSLPGGIYLISVQTPNNKQTRKLIVH